MADGTASMTARYWNTGLFFSWLCIVYMSLCSIPAQFYYRYAVLGRQDVSVTFASPDALCLPVYQLVVPVLITALICELTAASLDLSDGTLASAYSLLSTPNVRQALLKYSDVEASTNTGTLNRLTTIGKNVYVFAAIAYFSVRIWLRLRESMAHLSGANQRELQRQLNRVLAVQALCPIILSLIPPVLFNVIGLLGLASFGHEEQAVLTVLLLLNPVVNSLLTLGMIKPYRREISKWLLCTKESRVDSIELTPSHNPTNSTVSAFCNLLSSPQLIEGSSPSGVGGSVHFSIATTT
jgi:hypothetical protein